VGWREGLDLGMPTMDIKEILTSQRELYLKALLEFYNENRSGAKEILLELDNAEDVHEFKLYRLDHYDQVDGEPRSTEINSDKYLDFEPLKYHYDELRVEMNPFYWNGCEFILHPKPANNDWLIAWIKKWIDEEDKNPEDADGLSGVIHNVSKPDYEYSFSVDFGSTGIDAFLELIDEIHLQNVSDLRIGSFSISSAQAKRR
jgi:hypothetical protein